MTSTATASAPRLTVLDITRAAHHPAAQALSCGPVGVARRYWLEALGNKGGREGRRGRGGAVPPFPLHHISKHNRRNSRILEFETDAQPRQTVERNTKGLRKHKRSITLNAVDGPVAIPPEPLTPRFRSQRQKPSSTNGINQRSNTPPQAVQAAFRLTNHPSTPAMLRLVVINR